MNSKSDDERGRGREEGREVEGAYQVLVLDVPHAIVDAAEQAGWLVGELLDDFAAELLAALDAEAQVRGIRNLHAAFVSL